MPPIAEMSSRSRCGKRAPSDEPRGGARFEALVAEGQAAEREAQPAAARAAYEAALRRLGRTEGSRAAALTRWIGRTWITEGDLDAADDCFAASLEIAAAHASLSDQAHALNLSGIAQFHRGAIDRAVEAFDRSRGHAVAAGDAQLVAMVDHHLGIIANLRGETIRAMEHYHRSLDGLRSLEQFDHAVKVQNNLGLLLTEVGKHEEAELCFEDVIGHCTVSGDMAMRLVAEGNRIALWVAKREFDQAEAACDAALLLASGHGDRATLAGLHRHRGVILRETGRLDDAEEAFARASALATEIGNLLIVAETAHDQAELYWRQEKHRETLDRLNSAHRLFSKLQASRQLADIGRRTARLETLFLDIVRRWSESIESADAYTQGHCVRVADHACALASASGMDEVTLLWFRMGALLHDVGKIVVPPEVLNKPGRLTDAERAIIERHPDAGVELLAGIDFPWDVIPMVRHHHERWEGGGYPTGIAGEEIPFSARILCIADVYDALTTDRPYRAGFAHEKAIEIMSTGMRGHFDPALFETFCRITDPRFRAADAAGDSCGRSVIRAA
jgi:putative nucleotidyltransferase with HDIG domain